MYHLPVPKGAAENSPGREPGVRITKMESPEGATLKSIRRIYCAAPSGLNICFLSTPGSRPGLFSAIAVQINRKSAMALLISLGFDRLNTSIKNEVG